VGKEGMRLLHNNLSFVRSMNNDYQSDFSGAVKPGTSIKVRKPAQWKIRSGASFSSETFVEQYNELTMGDEKGVDTTITSKEMSLSLDQISARKIRPQMSRLASEIDSEHINKAAKYALNYRASAGTNLAFIDAVAMLGQMSSLCMPDETPFLFVNPTDQVHFLSDTKGLFQAQAQLSEQYLKGRLAGTYGGFQPIQTNLLGLITPPADVAGAVTTTVANGGVAIVCKSFGDAQVIPEGAFVTCAGVYDVNPETKQVLPTLKAIKVLNAETTGTGGSAGVVTLDIEALFDDTDSRQNVSALPQADAVLTILGTASTAYRQNLAIHRDAYTIAFADLDIPEGETAHKETMDNITLRYIQQYDIGTNAYKSRWDVISAGCPLRNEWSGILSDF
jgi:hypothetical protein